MSYRRVFIDAGANTGQSSIILRHVFPYGKNYQIFAFESHPEMYNELEKWKNFLINSYSEYNEYSIITSNKAIWTEDTSLDFFIGRPESATLRLDKNPKKVNYNKPIKVDTLDLGTWIRENFTKDDYVVLKMDIEGAEFDVIPDLIQKRAFDFIDEFYCEFHHNSLSSVNEVDYFNVLKNLNSIGVQPKVWFTDLDIQSRTIFKNLLPAL
tara:strand:- start:2754 stop:3383 length:630 start_codon:yes stop_codon:yes gene_type:complete